MKKIKQIMIPFVLIICFNSALTGTGYTQNMIFADVSAEDWFTENIVWGVENQIIQGYPDGTFRPNEAVTEAEFLAILFRLVDQDALQYNIERHGGDIWKKRVISAQEQTKSPAEDGQFWATNIYLASQALHLEIKEELQRNAPLTRGEVAIILVKFLSGQTLEEQDAVQYLLDSQLSKGKTEATYAGFAPEEQLTRGETVTFLKRLTTPLNRPQVRVD